MCSAQAAIWATHVSPPAKGGSMGEYFGDRWGISSVLFPATYFGDRWVTSYGNGTNGGAE
jgi:hypothetical protein